MSPRDERRRRLVPDDAVTRTAIPRDTTTAVAAALRAQAATIVALAEAIEAGARSTPTTPRYATAKHNPIGSARGFKTACRTVDTFMLGRETACLWADLERYLEARKPPPRTPPVAKPRETDPDRAALVAAGVRLGPARETRIASRGRR